MPAAARSELQRRLSAGRWPALRLALPLAVPQADASPKLICSRSVLVGENTSAIFMKEPVVLLSLGPLRQQVVSLVLVDLVEAGINSFHWVTSVTQMVVEDTTFL